MIDKSRDEFFTGIYSYDFYKEGPVPLKDSSYEFKFSIYIQDNEFDNDDNPYAEIKLRKLTNMDNMFDYQDRIQDPIRKEFLDLKECSETESDTYSSDVKIYCPDWTDDDFLFGDYYSEK